MHKEQIFAKIDCQKMFSEDLLKKNDLEDLRHFITKFNKFNQYKYKLINKLLILINYETNTIIDQYCHTNGNVILYEG